MSKDQPKTREKVQQLVEKFYREQSTGVITQYAEGHEIEQLKRQIEKTDREINERVYELYGISDGEKRLIETDVKRGPLKIE